jgi:hypothetical protein
MRVDQSCIADIADLPQRIPDMAESLVIAGEV